VGGGRDFSSSHASFNVSKRSSKISRSRQRLAKNVCQQKPRITCPTALSVHSLFGHQKNKSSTKMRDKIHLRSTFTLYWGGAFTYGTPHMLKRRLRPL